MLQAIFALGGPSLGTKTSNHGLSRIAYNIPAGNSTGSPLSIVSSTSALCSGGTVTLSAYGASSYYWNGLGTGSVIVVSPSVTTSYMVSGTNACSTPSAAIVVTVHPLPAVSVSSPTASICRGQSVSLTATGANSYMWSTGQPVAIISVSPAGTTAYSVIGTNMQGCVNQAFYTVSVTICNNVQLQSYEAGITLYPNPVEDFLFIRMAGPCTLVDLTILNALGGWIKTIDAKQLLTLQDGILKADLGPLPQGIYFIRLQDDKTSVIHKVIKE